jgi:hypothetical protein
MIKEIKMSNRDDAVLITQEIIDKIKAHEKDNMGLITPITMTIFASIHEEKGEKFLIDVRDTLYNIFIQSLLGFYIEDIKGDVDWSHEIEKLKTFIEEGSINEIDDPSLKFFFKKVYEIFNLAYVKNQVTDALFLMLALRMFILYLLESER